MGMDRSSSPRGALRARLLVLVALGVLGPATGAGALPLWELDLEPGDMQNNFNVPKLRLENLSTAGERIVDFRITIGDPDFFFDFVADLDSTPPGTAANVASEVATGASLVVGDRENDRAGVAELAWSFTDFQAFETLVFEVDVDPNDAASGGAQTADARQVLFDNGADPNAQVTLLFSDGSQSDLVLPDSSGGGSSFTFANNVPEPAAAVLLAAGAVGLGLAVRRRCAVAGGGVRRSPEAERRGQGTASPGTRS